MNPMYLVNDLVLAFGVVILVTTIVTFAALSAWSSPRPPRNG